MSRPRRKEGNRTESGRRTESGGRKESVGRCPICGHQRDEKFRPFCSKRCADLDLARWLEGRYVIPGKDANEDGSEPPAKPADNDE